MLRRDIPDDLNQLPARIVVSVIRDDEDEEVNEEDGDDMEHEAGNNNEEIAVENEEPGQDLADDDEEEHEEDGQVMEDAAGDNGPGVNDDDNERRNEDEEILIDAQDEFNNEEVGGVEEPQDEEDREDQKVEWTDLGLTTLQWIHHIHSIFRSSTPFEFVQSRVFQSLDVPSLRKDLPRFTKVSIFGRDMDEENKEIARSVLKTFAQDVKAISLYNDPFDPTYSVQDLGILNLDHLKLTRMEQVKLDDLLSINAKEIDISTESTISLQILNRFLRSWIRGANPRLINIHFQCVSDDLTDVNILVNGIDYQNMRELERNVENGNNEIAIELSFEIRNRTGISGTVSVYLDWFVLIVDFLVQD